MVKRNTVNGRELAVRRLRVGQELRFTHILFVSTLEKKHLTQILQSLKGSSVLIGAQTDGAVQSRGAINFVLEQDRVRFEINRDDAARVRVKISSKLLAPARSVTDNRVGGND